MLEPERFGDHAALRDKLLSTRSWALQQDEPYRVEPIVRVQERSEPKVFPHQQAVLRSLEERGFASTE